MSELIDEPATESDIAAAATAPEPVVDAPVADEPEAPVATGIDWDDPDVQARIAQMSQQAQIQLLEQLGLVTYDQPQQQQGPPVPDPLSDTYAQDLEAWYAAKQAESQAPIQQWIQNQQQQQVNGQIGQVLGQTLADLDIKLPEDPAEQGQFASAFLALADSFAETAAQQYGQTPQAAQAAARMAGEWLVARDKASSDAGVAAYKESLQAPIPGSTPYEPGVRGAGIPGDEMPASEAEAARRFMTRVPA